MTDSPAILKSLDPYHQRIGYLGALTTVANRGLDTANAVRERLSNVLHAKIYPEDAIYATLMQCVSPARRTILKRLHEQHVAKDLASVFRTKDESPWFYLSEFWLCDDQMPSSIGFVSPKKVSRLVDLSKWCGILRSTYELSEVGYVLYLLLDELKVKSPSPAAFNLINARCRMGAALIYFRLLLGAESLWPFLIVELVERKLRGELLSTQGPENLLGMAVERMLRTIGEPKSPVDVLPLRAVLDFRRAVTGSSSTAENYLRPRLEMLVDLGLLSRSGEEQIQNRSFSYCVTDVTIALAEELRSVATPKLPIQEFLENRFFGSMARVYGAQSRTTAGVAERLLWFASSFSRSGRDLGFTPGSTVAHLACLLAWESGVVIELSEMMETIYEAKKGTWGGYLQLSGGSRFDREFFIRVRPGLIEKLNSELEANGSSPA